MHTLTALRTGALASARRLDLACGLTELPREVFDLADTLEVLNLSGNQLSTLPDDLPRLHRLRVVFCSDNAFTTLPGVLGSCGQLEMIGFKANRISHVPAKSLPPRLRWLILTDNAVETLPGTLGERPRLEKLMLAGNRLAHLPDLSSCGQLALLRLAANRLQTLPDWLLSMPRLAWLALGGNPVFHKLSHNVHRAEFPRISWEDLQIHRVLGEGASGVIHKAEWKKSEQLSTAVAVKLFKGTMTSDGLPDSEMAATLAAAGHPGLVGVEGVVHNPADPTPGLVLPLLDSTFLPLAGPPSFTSCSRDVYPDGFSLPVDKLLTITRSVAGAVAHLHARGLVHGDLYGHNILWNGVDRALLSDFGAASFFDPDDRATGDALQRLEVRAFGCLLEELLAAVDNPDDPRCTLLVGLRDACLQPRVADRPLFSDLAAALATVG
ncbi:leucine-rich repeat-containing protein kinase family protein [Sphaerotilus sp.]|uniref:leucine-rich repeat-containing protein kinase family protein n=1 Tax=Sphaerotilus sp. TaxID=2093942 RepID=UPI00286D8B8B|nr:leucine-rich repeat-containing protein kinase family protein [Sphaerotilus sp.]